MDGISSPTGVPAQQELEGGFYDDEDDDAWFEERNNDEDEEIMEVDRSVARCGEVDVERAISNVTS